MALHFPAVGDSTNHPEPTFRMWEATAATPRHLFGWSPFVMSWCLVQVKRSSSEGSIRSSKIADLERQVRLAGRKTGPYLYLWQKSHASYHGKIKSWFRPMIHSVTIRCFEHCICLRQCLTALQVEKLTKQLKASKKDSSKEGHVSMCRVDGKPDNPSGVTVRV